VAHDLAGRFADRQRHRAAGRPSPFLGAASWRRYYSLRNIVVIARRSGLGVAARVALVRGVAKPAASLLIDPRLAVDHLRLNAQAVRDGFAGRLGRTVEPDTGARRWTVPDAEVTRDRPTRRELVERFLDGSFDARTVVRQLVDDGVDPNEAEVLVQVLAPRVVGPAPRWGIGAPVDGGDLYADDPEDDVQEEAEDVPTAPLAAAGASR
jgi:hypothetical protein